MLAEWIRKVPREGTLKRSGALLHATMTISHVSLVGFVAHAIAKGEKNGRMG
jgi:hypothetical protein